jgi:hypothetical protein
MTRPTCVVMVSLTLPGARILTRAGLAGVVDTRVPTRATTWGAVKTRYR